MPRVFVKYDLITTCLDYYKSSFAAGYRMNNKI